MKAKSNNAIQIALCLTMGMAASAFSNPALAGGSTLDACITTFVNKYAEYREVFGAKFVVVECTKEWNMRQVSIGAELTNYDDYPENFIIRSMEPKAYLRDFKVEHECSIQFPVLIGEEPPIFGSTTIEIQFEEDGEMGKWKKFVRDDACELAKADYLADQDE